MRHLAALIVALLLALPSAALANPGVYSAPEDERISTHVRPGSNAGPTVASMRECDEEGVWVNLRGWIVRFLPIILGQDRPWDAE